MLSAKWSGIFCFWPAKEMIFYTTIHTGNCKKSIHLRIKKEHVHMPYIPLSQRNVEKTPLSCKNWQRRCRTTEVIMSASVFLVQSSGPVCVGFAPEAPLGIWSLFVNCVNIGNHHLRVNLTFSQATLSQNLGKIQFVPEKWFSANGSRAGGQFFKIMHPHL